MSDDYSDDLQALRGAVRRYDTGGGVAPIPAPGGGYMDPTTGLPLPSYMMDPAAQQNQAIMQAQQYQAMMRASQQGQGQQQQSPPTPAPTPMPQATQATPAPAQAAAPSGAGSALTGALSNPFVGALLGAGLGALGGGRNGAIAGAIGGPMLGSNMANALNAAQAQDPNTSLAALSAKYLPLLAASYAGSMYRNPTAPQYGRPASQSASLQTPTPTGAPKPKPGSWYTYGQVPDYTLSPPGQAKGGMQRGEASSSLASAGEVAPSETGEPFIQGDGSGVEDRVPARLSPGEYVVPAHVVSALGDGSSEAGAKTLDRLQDNVRLRQGKQMAKDKHPRKMPPPEKVMDEDFEP
jgi:hypothetical protein